MSTPLVQEPTLRELADDLADFDLDAEVSVALFDSQPAVSSDWVCTPGCTSPGGGSFCSYCCC